MNKRAVKRLIKKCVYFIGFIMIVSLITSAIVQKRMERASKDVTPLTDIYGDEVTSPFPPVNIRTRRQRPPVQHRHFDQNPFMQHISEFIGDQLPTTNGQMHDWHDYAAMLADSERIGMGEQGVAAYLNHNGNQTLMELEKEIAFDHGFNAMLSDAISVNRSVPDVRHERCRSKIYLKELPTISVVIPCHDEHLGVLIRTIYSIVNRTPRELLNDIIVVDDGSEREYLKTPLDDYIKVNFSHIPAIQVLHLPERLGLIGARLAGARRAKGNVLIFFDSHIECNYNWLPPLLEPIALNSRVVTCPIVDSIDHANFEYRGSVNIGTRGAFNWKMLYKSMARWPDDDFDEILPYRNPIMMGGLFAISTEFFWELGGYDSQLDIWGAEQFELSFKIWMCGGILLDVPCSHVAHIFRGPWRSRPNPRNYNFMARNIKRVAEVWMDEYKEYIYNRSPGTYDDVDAGDLTAEKARRQRLKCKSFKWFLDEVAPDLLVLYPPVLPPSYFKGAIQSVAFPSRCLDTMNRESNEPIGIFQCAENLTFPQDNQFWELTWQKDIRKYDTEICLDVQDGVNSTIWMWNCHGQGGNQLWYYDRDNQLLIHGPNKRTCLEAVEYQSNYYDVVGNPCDPTNERMKWTIGYVNHTALDLFYDEK